MASFCEQGYEPSSSFIKDREFPDQLNDYHLLKKDSVP
jgi:hypothetical protein